MLHRSTCFLFIVSLATAALVGCGPRTETYEMPTKTAVTQARELFQGYASGNPATSEVETYPQLIEQVRAEDPKAAEVIVPALEKIKANPAGVKATATQALKDLDAVAPATPPAAS